MAMIMSQETVPMRSPRMAIESSDSRPIGPTRDDLSEMASSALSKVGSLISESRQSCGSSASALSDNSELSLLSSSALSLATTLSELASEDTQKMDNDTLRRITSTAPATPIPEPHVLDAPPIHSSPKTRRLPRSAPRRQYNVRPKMSIPHDLEPSEYALQCIEAAESSRLNPYALHHDEYMMLREHISYGQVTTYLNLRNGILRLWINNPQIAVTRDEAVGCARDTRWFDVASVCFDWLMRCGYINFGCVEIVSRFRRRSSDGEPPRKRRTVAIIGAGMSGLGCARHLEGLCAEYSKKFRAIGEAPPRILLLEGRSRVGGRVYSKAFQTLPDTASSKFRGKRFTAEMGGMIITGFDRGNPMNILVRGQLGLPYRALRSEMSLYNMMPEQVDLQRDQMVEKLFNACLDRVSEHKFKIPIPKVIEGNHEMIDEGRDSMAEGHKTIAAVEEASAAHNQTSLVPDARNPAEVLLVPVSTQRTTGRPQLEPGRPGITLAAAKIKSIGWQLKPGVTENDDVDTESLAKDPTATLGTLVDETIRQHKDLVDLGPQDFRLINWHIANLEYSNATNIHNLSLQGWDIDAGNEWDGKHTMVVGGYQSVGRGLLLFPKPMEIHHKAAVARISYSSHDSASPATISCEDGSSIEADHVVSTIPLGVLKHGDVEFDPPLPAWKNSVIERLGFGVLNKVILVFSKAFWRADRDIFGILRNPENSQSTDQKDYRSARGRMFQWFNVSGTTGMPCLIALMAGDAGFDTETASNDEVIEEAMQVLRSRYGDDILPPLEAIVTRWGSDRFARGSYSSAGPDMTVDDYDIMARPIGNLHFAGEHTTGTHPATVHGAYLSGLRAASEVFDALLGPIEVPVPLVLPRETSASLKRKADEGQKDPTQARLEAYELDIWEHIKSKIGLCPWKPAKMAGNAYLLYIKANYEAARTRCEQGRRPGKGKPSPNEVRTMSAKMWREASAEEKQPFEDQAEEQKRANAEALKKWTETAMEWERQAVELRAAYVADHPYVTGREDGAPSGFGSEKRRVAAKVETYAESEDSDVDMSED